MAQSSLLGIDRAARRAGGTDTESLGPSDTTDSGSDVIGAELSADLDPALPVDAALDDDARHPATSVEAIRGGADSDAAGTGERRSAAGDAGARDGADLLPDHVESLGDAEDDDDADDLAALDAVPDAALDDSEFEDDDDGAGDRDDDTAAAAADLAARGR